MAQLLALLAGVLLHPLGAYFHFGFLVLAVICLAMPSWMIAQLLVGQHFREPYPRDLLWLVSGTVALAAILHPAVPGAVLEVVSHSGDPIREIMVDRYWASKTIRPLLHWLYPPSLLLLGFAAAWPWAYARVALAKASDPWRRGP